MCALARSLIAPPHPAPPRPARPRPAPSHRVDSAEDLPLVYSYYYAIVGDAAGTEFQLLASSPSTSYAGALLPRGTNNASEIEAIAYVADQLGAAARGSDVAVVAPSAASVGDVANGTAALLSAAFAVGSPEGVHQAAVASASVLNAPNCSLNCAALGRGACDVWPNVCGACSGALVGAASPSNAPCYAAAPTHCANGALDATEGETGVDCGGSVCAPCAEGLHADVPAKGAGCAADSDCLYEVCGGGGVCVTPPKPCALNCSWPLGGTCGWTDGDGRALSATDCRADDTACFASCACRAGFSGLACADDAAAHDALAALRGSLLVALTGAAALQDESAEAYQQQVGTQGGAGVIIARKPG